MLLHVVAVAVVAVVAVTIVAVVVGGGVEAAVDCVAVVEGIHSITVVDWFADDCAPAACTDAY